MKQIVMGLVGAVVLVLLYSWDDIQHAMNPPPDYASVHGGKVVLYATSWCGYCQKTRELLQANNIDYFEYDIETSEEGRAQYDTLGGRGVPVLLVNGRLLKGYKPDEILKYAKGS